MKKSDLPFEDLVRRELDRARELHPGDQPSIHHGVAVIEEEFLEMRAAAFSKDLNKRKLLAIKKELVQIACVCQRMSEDVIDEMLGDIELGKEAAADMARDRFTDDDR